VINTPTLKICTYGQTLRIQIFLFSNQKTLFDILEALAQPAELRDLTTEVALNLLKAIYPNPKLLHHLQEQLS